MAHKYEWERNPFRDFFIRSVEHGVDIADAKFKKEIHSSLIFILENLLESPEEALYFNFEIINDDGEYKIIGKNCVSALWLSGILISNVKTLVHSKVFLLGNRKYKYNEKTNELTYKTITHE